MVHSNDKQAGVTLVIVLIVLVVITLLGITTIKSATLSEKMAGNQRKQQVTFQAAERALRYCEQAVLAYAKNPDHYELEPAPFEADENTNHFEDEENWNDVQKFIPIAGLKEALNLSMDPKCMVELINDRTQLPEIARSFDDKPLIYPYRITVRAYGPVNTNSVISLQSYLRI